MIIEVCGRKKEVARNTTLFQLRNKVKKNADILVINGLQAETNIPLKNGDKVVLLKRGEIPSKTEMNFQLVAKYNATMSKILQKATVGIAGIGGLGSSVAVALARTGIGKLILVDYDIVEPSNLNRQQYFIDQIGMPKTEALRQNIERINPYVTLEIHHTKLDKKNIPQIFRHVDILVEAVDKAHFKETILSSFTTAYPKKPLILASGMAGYDSGNTIQTKAFGKNVYISGDFVSSADCGTGLFAPRVGIVAHHQANTVLSLLLNNKTSSTRRK